MRFFKRFFLNSEKNKSSEEIISETQLGNKEYGFNSRRLCRHCSSTSSTSNFSYRSNCNRGCPNHRGSRNSGRLVQVRTKHHQETVLRRKIVNLVTGAAAFVLIVAVPVASADIASAAQATALPGFVYVPMVDSQYQQQERLECPADAATIFDCRIYGWIHGSSYDFITKNLNRPNNLPSGEPDPDKSAGAEAPVVVRFIASVTYNEASTGTPVSRTLRVVGNVEWDYVTNRARYVLDLSDFFFDDFADADGSWRTATTWPDIPSRLGGSSSQNVATCLSQFNDGAVKDKGVRPDVFEAYKEFDMACITMGKSRKVTTIPTTVPFSHANAARATSLTIDLVKSPVTVTPAMSDDFFVYFTGQINTGLTKDYKTIGYPTVIDPSKGQYASISPTGTGAGCSAAVPVTGWTSTNPISWQGETLFTAAPQAHGLYKSPSATTIFTWFPTAPPAASCYVKNKERYIPYTVTGMLNNPYQSITKEELDKIVDNEDIAVVDGTSTYVRPSFAECIDINPLSFKWDWPCIFEALFTTSPTSIDQLTDANTDVMTRVPFAYFPVLISTSETMFSTTGSCTPWKIPLMGQQITVFPCISSFRDVFRPITTWGFSILITLQVGTWAFRKVAPTLPGDQ